ncbi:lectin C-type domain protein [Oesophagostomum dentatum]|uniref:Lectin C-type domain protein n=1 Tax=Oesophagostomum dentatum TaxID=61180 RepID=A0A0B1SXI0_OESDE|nr:lectin C-type domain protein [Oesophagostomum dentatum]
MYSTFSVLAFAFISSGKLGGILAQEEISPLEQRFAFLVSHVQTVDSQVEELQKRVAQLEQIAHTHPNTTDIGTHHVAPGAEPSAGHGIATDGTFSYKLFDGKTTWEDAQKYCHSLNAYLTVVNNEAKNNIVRGLLNQVSTVDRAWIGTKIRGRFDSSQTTFNNFEKKSSYGCAAMDHTGLWSIHSCDQLYPFVCEMMKLPK